jgi:3-phytase
MKLRILPVFAALAMLGVAADAAAQALTVQRTLRQAATRDQDDLCFWLHPTDAALSTIIVSDKAADRLFVYDLQGALLQSVVTGQPGNIDSRYGFPLGGTLVDIVAYNERDTDRIRVFKVDPATRLLAPIDNGGFPSGDNYGFTLYRNPLTNRFYALTGPGDNTVVKQWELVDNGAGVVTGVGPLRQMPFTGTVESMVGDDDTGRLYVCQENGGVWEFGGDPDQPATGVRFAPVNTNGLTEDVEGIAIYHTAGAGGYLIVSSQGSDDYKVYDREPPHAFRGTFSISGVSDTDGLDVLNLPLGPEFPQGVLAFHNGVVSPYPTQMVGWEAVANALGLAIDPFSWSPRGPVGPVHAVAVSVTGSGAVSPPGGDYVEGATARLTATPELGWSFARWEGDVASTDNPLALLVDGPKSVTAVFEAAPLRALTTTVVGQGQVSPADGSFLSGSTVSLTATPATGWRFTGWSGDLGGTANPAALVMSADRAVTATFTELPPARVTHRGTVTTGVSDTRTVRTGSNVTAAAGQVYLAAISTEPRRTVSSVSGLGLTWTRIKDQCGSRGRIGVSLWIGRGTPTASARVTATLASSTDDAVISVSRYSDVDLATPLGLVRSANSRGVDGLCSSGVDQTSYSVPFATAVAGGAVYGSVAIRGRTHTAGAGYTERADLLRGGSSGAGLAVEDRTLDPAATSNLIGAFSGSAEWAAVAVELRPAGAPAAAAERVASAATEAETEVEAASASAGLALGRVTAAPNPFGAATEIRFELARAASVEAAVFDAAGRRLATLATGALAAGRHAVAWRGESARGERLPNGVYFVRVRTGAEMRVAKVVLGR